MRTMKAFIVVAVVAGSAGGCAQDAAAQDRNPAFDDDLRGALMKAAVKATRDVFERCMEDAPKCQCWAVGDAFLLAHGAWAADRHAVWGVDGWPHEERVFSRRELAIPTMAAEAVRAECTPPRSIPR